MIHNLLWRKEMSEDFRRIYLHILLSWCELVDAYKRLALILSESSGRDRSDWHSFSPFLTQIFIFSCSCFPLPRSRVRSRFERTPSNVRLQTDIRKKHHLEKVTLSTGTTPLRSRVQLQEIRKCCRKPNEPEQNTIESWTKWGMPYFHAPI